MYIVQPFGRDRSFVRQTTDRAQGLGFGLVGLVLELVDSIRLCSVAMQTLRLICCSEALVCLRNISCRGVVAYDELHSEHIKIQGGTICKKNAPKRAIFHSSQKIFWAGKTPHTSPPLGAFGASILMPSVLDHHQPPTPSMTSEIRHWGRHA